MITYIADRLIYKKKVGIDIKLYYFKQEDDMYKKYEASFDTEALNKLNREIIDNCSEIKHIEIERISRFVDGLINSKRVSCEYRNVIRGPKVGVKDYNNGPHENIYKYSFDEYTYPPILKNY